MLTWYYYNSIKYEGILKIHEGHEMNDEIELHDGFIEVNLADGGSLTESMSDKRSGRLQAKVRFKL